VEYISLRLRLTLGFPIVIELELGLSALYNRVNAMDVERLISVATSEFYLQGFQLLKRALIFTIYFEARIYHNPKPTQLRPVMIPFVNPQFIVNLLQESYLE
jgi:hypothetical protein